MGMAGRQYPLLAVMLVACRAAAAAWSHRQVRPAERRAGTPSDAVASSQKPAQHADGGPAWAAEQRLQETRQTEGQGCCALLSRPAS